jgi:hypothetical protein
MSDRVFKWVDRDDTTYDRFIDLVYFGRSFRRDGGQRSGDREPRRRLPTLDSGAIALDLPADD